MREIKFRAKVDGKVVYSDGFMKHPNGTIIVIIDIMDEGFKTCPIDEGTLEQFTGLKDNKRTKEFPNGQDIYEGDTVRRIGTSNCSEFSGIVKYESIGFTTIDYDLPFDNDCVLGYQTEFIEVIGNIHENKL
jgi:uncharacterized phage protein (TIGR01671 family)